MRPDDPQSEAFALMDSFSFGAFAGREHKHKYPHDDAIPKNIVFSILLLSQISKGNHEAEASEEVRADADAQIIFI